MRDNRYVESNNNPIEDLLKPRDVCKKLNISRSFTYRLLKSGELPSVRLGKTYRVRNQDLVEFIGRNLKGNTDN